MTADRKPRHDYRYTRGRTPICERCGCRRRSVGTLRKWEYSLDGKTWTAERPPCKGGAGWSDAIAALPRFGVRVPVRAADLDKAAEALVKAFWLYSGYTVGSRGPAGCILDALDEIAPEAAKEIRNGDEAHDVYQRRWSDKS